MLANGIYEQIINTKISNELAQLDPQKYDMKLENLSADDSRRVLTLYISYVIEQALRYIRDSFPSTKDEEALLAQIRLCNDIVKEIAEHTDEPDFEDNAILEKGEVLVSLYNKLNSARNMNKLKIIRPETSIVENVLFTGSRNEPSMLSELKREILSSDSIDLLVSFIKWSAVRQLITELRKFTKRDDVRLRIITTTYIILDLKHRMQYDTLTGGRLHLNRERELEEQAEEIERAAVFEAKSDMVLKDIIEKEGFSATEQELEAAAREFAERENTTLELVRRFFGEDYSGLEKSVKEKKAKAWIYNQLN